jgi:hypothetical protein
VTTATLNTLGRASRWPTTRTRSSSSSPADSCEGSCTRLDIGVPGREASWQSTSRDPALVVGSDRVSLEDDRRSHHHSLRLDCDPAPVGFVLVHGSTIPRGVTLWRPTRERVGMTTTVVVQAIKDPYPTSRS